MNAEQLHAMAASLVADSQATQVSGSLQRLRDSLASQVSSPQDQATQQQVAVALGELEQSLQQSRTNNYSPLWQESLEEMGLWNLTGSRLLAAIRDIFARNAITVVVARDEITEMASQVSRMEAELTALAAALNYLRIPDESLGAGQTEVGVLIPRPAVHNELSDLGRELIQLERLLAPYVELATGSRARLQVSSIASSDFGVFLQVAPGVAALLVVSLERLLTVYKSVLEIRLLHSQLKEQGVPETALSGVALEATSRMQVAIEEEAKRLVGLGVVTDPGRRNELEIEVTRSLNGLANRIDQGYSVDVRAGVEDVADDAPSQLTEETQEHIRIVVQVSPSLRLDRFGGAPILSLTEALPNSDDEGTRPNA